METAATVEETARIDADGSIVETHGECKQGMGPSYNGIWGYHPSADRQFWDEWDSGRAVSLPGRSRSRRAHRDARAPLVGVEPELIADDYELSHDRLRVAYAARGEPDQGPELMAYLSEIGTTARYVIVETLRSLDVEARLRASGFSETDVASVRRRLLGPG